ncbi:MAG: YegP family protein [Flavobacterium sp.]
MGKFVITKKDCGRFQVHLKSKTGKVLLSSEEYLTKISCKKNIEKLRIYASQADKFQKKTTVDWELYFYLKASGGKTIGTSTKFPSELSREQAIKIVQKIAPTAPVENLA